MQQEKKDKTIKWKINLDGDDYEIKVDLNPWTGKHKIYVDDEPVRFDTPALVSFVAGFDQYIKIGCHDIFVTLRKGKMDLAINGKMLSNGKLFVPLPDAPKWMWALSAACVPLPVVSYFISPGMLPFVVAISITAIYACIYFAMQSDKGERIRAKICTFIISIPWAVFVLMPLFSKLFGNIFK
jgi:hypothetical protein